MRLPREFYRLPLRFDAERMREEVLAMPQSAWSAHPNDYAGNSSVRLISVGGGENDEVAGAMRATPHLQRCPYITQVLASFGVVWSRSRLMRLAPHSSVPEHADINHHWFNRVRVHVPVMTRPEVSFHCGASVVHMAAGEAWIFDNWRRHRVENPTDDWRVHLVADTSGTASFWQMVADGSQVGAPTRDITFQPSLAPTLLTEQHNVQAVMPPAEVELLVGDLIAELAPAGADEEALRATSRFQMLLDGFCREWRQVWSLYGGSENGIATHRRLLEMMRQRGAAESAGITMRTNGVPAMQVLEARVLRSALPDNSRITATGSGAAEQAPRRALKLDRPVFIVAAPRSGSTLLFETLACSRSFWTLGGEAHWLIESAAHLRPDIGEVDSNRLTESHWTVAVERHVREVLSANLRDAGGAAWRGESPVRLLEKTPKNALRIPFLRRLFPDALFVFLWRDPRENISSIIEGWRAGQWVTYPRLSGWQGPWSFLLPPDWQSQAGRPLEEIAAWQWNQTNRVVLDDLESLDRRQWTSLSYADFLRDPGACVEQVCAFAGIPFDGALRERTAAPLPLSRHTHTEPAPDKWRRNEAAIEKVLTGVEATWRALRGLQPANA